ncbi:MAG: RNA methyltransferase [Deltaproteobacteria bacterium]|nr:RNA methyltransferase [Deltaproteobacteria bacterium]
MRGRRKAREKKKSPVFDNIEIVLVEPQSPGNVGSVARAMKNTGFKRLVLINPCDYKNNEAYSMACKADDVLKGATVLPALADCVKDTGLVIGTTRRQGRIRYPILTLDEAVPKILEFGSKNRVSILFGREDRGLENDEIPVCDILLEIPADEDYGSLNLSHAVFLVCYRLFAAECARAPTVKVAPREELERMYLHMEEALRALSYGEMGGVHLLESILRSFRRLFGRTGLMQKEINMLRGIFAQIEGRVSKAQADEPGPDKLKTGARREPSLETGAACRQTAPLRRKISKE